MSEIRYMQMDDKEFWYSITIIDSFVKGAEESGHSVEVISPVKDCALLMTSADDFFRTFEQAVSYYQFTLVNYIGFRDKGMVLAGGCGDTNGGPRIDKTDHLQTAYEFGKSIY